MEKCQACGASRSVMLAAAQLWDALLEHLFFDGCTELESWDLQEMAEAAGLIQAEEYDPVKHGQNFEGELGDMIYVLTDLGKELYLCWTKTT